MSYRVATTNPFDLLSDENERPNAPKKQPPKEKPAATPAPAAPTAKAASKPAAQQNKPAPAQSKPQPQKDQKPASAPAKPAPATSKPDAKAAAQAPAKPANAQHKAPASPAPARDEASQFTEKDKEARAPRGTDRRDRPPKALRGGRVFDRKSGTGRSPTENKKGGYGKGNWGSELGDTSAADAPKEKEEVEAADKDAVKAETAPAGDAAAAAAVEVKEEPKQLSLGQYYAQLKRPQVEALKPREVSNDFASAGLIPLKKEEFVSVKQVPQPKEANGKAPEESKEKKDKKPKEINASDLLNFQLPPHQEESGRGRGGRGGFGREGGRREGGRGRREGGRREGGVRPGGRGAAPADSHAAPASEFSLASFPPLSGAAATAASK